MNKITKETTANKQPEFYHPSVTADILCLERTNVPNKFYLYLIRRDQQAKAFPGCLAVPGGFMDFDDNSIEECAVRELREETGIEVDPDSLILNGVHTRKGRDPRGPVHSTSFYTFVGKKNLNRLAAGDDAGEVLKCAMYYDTGRIELIDEKGKQLSWIAVTGIGDNVKVINKPEEIAFDHAEIIAKMVSNLVEHNVIMEFREEEYRRDRSREEFICKLKETCFRQKARIENLKRRCK